jgi:hypothetical protein
MQFECYHTMLACITGVLSSVRNGTTLTSPERPMTNELPWGVWYAYSTSFPRCVTTVLFSDCESLPAIRPSGLPENVETDLKARLHSFRKLRRTVATLFQLSLDPLEGGEK